MNRTAEREETMKSKSTLLVVTSIEESKRFYRDVLGLHVLMDFGTNITLSGGVCLQSLESWEGLLHLPQGLVSFGGKDAELYFEEDRFDRFLERLEKLQRVQYVHPVYEHRWGQRVVRLYDPDMHIIEVGENLKGVCRRFLDTGMSAEEVAKRMEVPLSFVKACIGRSRPNQSKS